jgi:NitT/TauT family transport system permease protein
VSDAALDPRASGATRGDAAPDTVWTERVSLSERMPRWLGMTLVFLAFIGTWQAVVSAGLVSPIILPAPAEVLEDLIFVGSNILSGGHMLRALWITMQEVAWGFAIALAIGFTLGVIVGETTFGERAILPYLVAIDTMPKVAFAPLFIAWLGFGIESKIALAAFVATFSVVVGTAAGLHAADENGRMLFKTMGASRWQTLTQLKMPAGLPQFFTGLKIASVSVMAGAITGEFLGGGRGFGELIRVASTNLDISRVFALIIYLSLVGLSLFMAVGYAQRRFVFWMRSSNSALP